LEWHITNYLKKKMLRLVSFYVFSFLVYIMKTENYFPFLLFWFLQLSFFYFKTLKQTPTILESNFKTKVNDILSYYKLSEEKSSPKLFVKL
jgi:hypothetical protein